MFAVGFFLPDLNLTAADLQNNPACVPERRSDWSEPVTKMWIDKAAKQKAAEGSIDVLFLGDSITQLWMDDVTWPNGQRIWDKYYKPLKAVNFGISADRTDHMLWRIGEGRMIEGLSPKVTVLLIGVNNLLGWQGRQGGDTPENLSLAIGLIMDNMKKQMPDSKILLLGIFPALEPASPPREKILKTNELISAQADFKKIFYLDIGDKFLLPDGNLNKDLIRDGVHLSEKGYEIWASSMNPYFLDLLNRNGNGKIWDALKRK